MEQNIEIIRSSRKTLSLQIKPDGRVIVRAPLRMPVREIKRFLEEKSDWLNTHLQKVAEANAAGEAEPISSEELHALAEQALREIPPKVAEYAARMCVTYGRITIRNQATRWGSCSAKGNLNFNCLLMLAPEDVLEYVIIHELAHRKQMNHSAAFWAEVEKMCPAYKEKRDWLKRNGASLMARMRH